MRRTRRTDPSRVRRGSSTDLSPYNERMEARRTWNPLWLPRDNDWLLWWAAKVTVIYAVMTQWEKLQAIYVAGCTDYGEVDA